MFTLIHDQIANLPLSRKLSLMALFLVAPALVIAGLFVTSQNVRVDSTVRQLDGLRYVRPVVELQLKLALHRGAAALALAGIGGTEPVRAAQAEVDLALGAVQAADAEFGDRFGTHTLIAELSETWTSNLRPNWNTANLALSYDMHTLILAQVTDVVRLVGQNAGMDFAAGEVAGKLDRTLVFTLPAGIESVGQLGAFGVVLSRAGSLNAPQWDQLAVLVQDVRRSTETLRAVVSRAAKTPGFDAVLKSASDQAVTSAEAFLDAVQEASAGRNGFGAEPTVHRAQADQVVNAFNSLRVRVAESLQSELVDTLSGLRAARNLELAAVSLLMVMALSLGFVIARTMNRQVRSMSTVFKRIREGDLSARAEVVAHDEFGSFAKALNLVLDNTIALVQSRSERDQIQANIRKLHQEMRGVAQGDLTQEAEVTEAVTGVIAQSFNLMLVELRGLIHRVKESAIAVNSAAHGAHVATGRLAEGSRSQSAQVVHASAAIEQMALSIQQVTAQAATAAQIAQTALRNAQSGSQSARLTIEGMGEIKRQVNDMANLVTELRASTAQIGDITQLIADISKRTSILALNASIQAAVAGDSGRGFGVVAEQVEELATRSSDAVRRVAALTKSIQASTGSVMDALEGATQKAAGGEALASQASDRLASIESVSTQLAGVVESILSACRQQSASSEAIAASMGEISQVTRHTSAGAQAATTSLGDLSNLVDELRNSVSRFRLPEGAGVES